MAGLARWLAGFYWNGWPNLHRYDLAAFIPIRSYPQKVGITMGTIRACALWHHRHKQLHQE